MPDKIFHAWAVANVAAAAICLAVAVVYLLH
jgi:hypothetical protein